MAQAGAMVHIVRAEARAHQLLEQVGFFVTTLGAAETRQSFLPMGIAQVGQLSCGQLQCLFPSGLAENRGPICAIAIKVIQCLRIFGDTWLADQGHGQALGVMHIVKPKAALHTQAAAVGNTITPVDTDDAIVFDVVGQQTAHATEGAHGVHFFVHHLGAGVCLGHECTGGAGLHTLTTCHAGALAHGVAQVEHNAAVIASERVSDHIVHLLFAAGPYTTVALNAGIQFHHHSRV